MQNFRISTAHVNSTTSALGYTVSQAIQAIQAYKDKPDDTMYAFYNEQAPGMLVNGKETEGKALTYYYILSHFRERL